MGAENSGIKLPWWEAVFRLPSSTKVEVHHLKKKKEKEKEKEKKKSIIHKR